MSRLSSPATRRRTIQPLILHLLGSVQVLRDGEPLSFTYNKSRMLLAYLALTEGRAHSRDELATLLWPELPERSARTNLRQVLVDLRQAVGDEQPALLLISRDSVQFVAAGLVRIDVAEFTRLLDQCEAHRHRHIARCGSCAARLERALGLYRGDLLAGLPGNESLTFSDWLRPLQEQLHTRAVEGLATLAAYHERNGDYPAALSSVRRQLALEPWREAAHRAAMRLHALQGDRGAALAQYARCRAAVTDAFGTEPESATTKLYQDLSKHRPLISPFAPPTPLRFPPDSAPPLGREEELAALGDLLADPGRRLITIVGPGGVGKTCLAVAVAGLNARAFADGVVYVPLAGVDDAKLLAATLLAALELAPQPGQTAEDQLFAYLQTRELLLVLDNLEHLLGGVELLARLIRQTSAVTLLVTSRTRLALRAEWLFDLTGLVVPMPNSSRDDLERNPAVGLFVQRAQQVQRRFTLDAETAAVVSICRSVEGLPLALELAASATRERRCVEIAAAFEAGTVALRNDLHDLPERQRSLQLAFNYSWQMLTSDEQRVLRQVSVFRDGFEQAEGAAVANATEQQLQALCDKSMLRRASDGRFVLHELIRQYAATHLLAASEAPMVQQRHLGAMLALAQQAEPGLVGAEQQLWLERLERDLNNMRVALSWGLDQRQFALTAQLGGALWRFWWRRNYLREGRDWLGRLLHLVIESGHDLEPSSRAKVLKGLAALTHRQGDFEEAQSYYQQELTLRRAIGTTPELVAAMSNLAATWSQQGRYGEADGLLEECVSIDRAQNDSYGLAHDLGSLGLSKLRQGFYAEADGLLSESLELHRSHEDTFSVALTLANLGSAAHGLRDYTALGRYTQEALSLMRTHNDSYNSAITLENLAYFYRDQGDMSLCRAVLQESLAIFLDVVSRDNLLSVVGTIAVTVLANQYERCVQLLSAVSAQHEQIGVPMHMLAYTEYEAALGPARSALGDCAYDAARAAGQAMGFDELVASARNWLDEPV